jgi:hypothetical protein
MVEKLRQITILHESQFIKLNNVTRPYAQLNGGMTFTEKMCVIFLISKNNRHKKPTYDCTYS